MDMKTGKCILSIRYTTPLTVAISQKRNSIEIRQGYLDKQSLTRFKGEGIRIELDLEWKTLTEENPAVYNKILQNAEKLVSENKIMEAMNAYREVMASAKKDSKEWKKESNPSEKDLVYIPIPAYSIEIKTSSNKNKIFGNRSYGQPSSNSKKSKEGYYLAINFEKFSESKNPKIRLIRFGWLDHSDWIAQKASTGQQARLTKDADKFKLIKIYPESKD